MTTKISSVKIALPTITRGLRVRLERRVGTVTCSGSSAARGDRGVRRFCSGNDVTTPSCGRPEMGG